MTPVGPRCPDHATQGQSKLRAPTRQRAARRVGYLQRSQPIVTWTLIGLNVLIYLITVGQGAGINQPGGTVYNKWDLYGPAVADGGWWRLLTAAFLHGNILHIALNMFVLYIIGGTIEQFLGPLRYVALYVVSGLAGSAGALVVTPCAHVCDPEHLVGRTRRRLDRRDPRHARARALRARAHRVWAAGIDRRRGADSRGHRQRCRGLLEGPRIRV